MLPVLSLNLFQSDFVPAIGPALLLPRSPVICTWSVVSSQSPSHLTFYCFLHPGDTAFPQASCCFTAFRTLFAQVSSFLAGGSAQSPLFGVLPYPRVKVTGHQGSLHPDFCSLFSRRDWQTFSGKGQITNLLSFVDHILSYSTLMWHKDSPR